MSGSTIATAAPRASAWRERLRREQTTLLWLLGIFLLGLGARALYVGVFVKFNSPPSYDGIFFDQLATNLLQGKGFVTAENLPTAFRTPGYPLFLTGLYMLFGHSMFIARLGNIVLGALTAPLLFPLGVTLFLRRRIGWLAALFGAVYPLLIYMTGELYSEILAIFLATLALVLYAAELRQPSRWRPAAAGLVIGLELMVRPNIVFALPFLALWFFLCAPRARALKLVAWLVAGLALMLIPWSIHNYTALHEFIPLTTQAGVKIWQGNNALADGSGLEPTAETWRDGPIPDRFFMGWKALGESESSRRFMNVAVTWMQTHPVETTLLLPQKILRLWSPMTFTTRSNRQLPPLQFGIVLVPWLIFIGTALWGAILYRRQWRNLFGLYAFILAVNLEAALTFGGTRYALPMAPSLLLLSAASVDWGLDKFMTRARLFRRRRDGEANFRHNSIKGARHAQTSLTQYRHRRRISNR